MVEADQQVTVEQREAEQAAIDMANAPQDLVRKGSNRVKIKLDNVGSSNSSPLAQPGSIAHETEPIAIEATNRSDELSGLPRSQHMGIYSQQDTARASRNTGFSDGLPGGQSIGIKDGFVKTNMVVMAYPRGQLERVQRNISTPQNPDFGMQHEFGGYVNFNEVQNLKLSSPYKQAPVPMDQYYLAGKAIGQSEQRMFGPDIEMPVRQSLHPKDRILSKDKHVYRMDDGQSDTQASPRVLVNINANENSVAEAAAALSSEANRAQLRKMRKSIRAQEAGNRQFLRYSQKTKDTENLLSGNSGTKTRNSMQVGITTKRYIQKGCEDSRGETLRDFQTSRSGNRFNIGALRNSYADEEVLHLHGQHDSATTGTHFTPGTKTPLYKRGGPVTSRNKDAMNSMLQSRLGQRNILNRFPSATDGQRNRKPQTATHLDGQKRPRITQDKITRTSNMSGTMLQQTDNEPVQAITLANHPWSGHFAESKPLGSTVCESMRVRNEHMRYDAMVKEKNQRLEQMLKEQSSEIQNLKAHLRDLFVGNEGKAMQKNYARKNEPINVASSYRQEQDAGAAGASQIILSPHTGSQHASQVVIENSTLSSPVSHDKNEFQASQLAPQEAALLNQSMEKGSLLSNTMKKPLSNYGQATGRSDFPSETAGKEVASFQGSSNVHQLYQDLYISDMKDEIDAVQGQSMNLRRSLMHEVSQTQDLHHENKLLKQKLATYRRMVQAQNNTAKPSHHPKQSVAQATIPTVMASSAELGTNNRVEDAKQVNRSHNHTIDSQAHDEGLTPKQTALAAELGLEVPVQDVLKAETLTDLLETVKRALMRILKCDDVNCMIIDKDTLRQYQKEGGRTVKKFHKANNRNFDVVVPPHVEDDHHVKRWAFHFAFEEMKSVAHGRIIDQKYIVWPVNSFHQANKKMLFLQVENHHKGKFTAQGAKEKRLMDLICQITSNCIERIFIQTTITANENRAHQILTAFEHILGQRNHIQLDKSLQEVFSELFQFEQVGVLFVDGVGDSKKNQPHLFKITHANNDQDQKELVLSGGFGDIVKFPRNIGLTGEAIQAKKIVVLQKGERVSNFASELDNMVNSLVLESILIGPIYDPNGNLRGVIQLVNKCGKEEYITPQIIEEMKLILPTLGEIFRTADEVRVIGNTMVDMEKSLKGVNAQLQGNLDGISKENLDEIGSLLTAAQNRADETHSAQKKELKVEEDGGLSKDIWSGLRQKLLNDKLKKSSPHGTRAGSQLSIKD